MNGSAGAAVEVDGLTKRFGAITAVDDLSFSVQPGEIFGLVGPDGAGKTTAMRMFASVMRPDAGSIVIDGIDVLAHPEKTKRHVSYMPQRFGLYEDLTVEENIRFYADLFEVPRKLWEARAQSMLVASDMTQFRQRLAGQLSGGMKQKLGLTCSLVHTPRVLLLDEPTTGVDPVSRREFWDLITDVHLQGRTVSPIEGRASKEPSLEGESVQKVTIVVSTPYLDEAERCTRVGLMHHGELIACDAPSALRANMPAVVLEGETDQAMRARTLAATHAGVRNAAMHGDVVRLLIDRADRQSALEAMWQEHGIQVRHLRIAPPRLEDAFVLMLGSKDG